MNPMRPSSQFMTFLTLILLIRREHSTSSASSCFRRRIQDVCTAIRSLPARTMLGATLAVTSIALNTHAQGSEPFVGKAMQQEMRRPGTVFFTDSPIREAFASLTANRRVAIWVDRRCDPEKTVSFMGNASLADNLWTLSNNDTTLDIAWSENLIYVSPPHTATNWASVHMLHQAALRRLPADVRSVWQRSQPWHWPRLTNPQHLLTQLQTELGRPIRNQEWIRHDLWPAGHFPALPLFERLELLVAGFDLSFSFDDDGGATLHRMPTHATYRRRLNLTREGRSQLNEFLRANPTVQLVSDGRTLDASWRQQEAFQRLIRPTPTVRPRRQSDVRYSLKATNRPLRSFLTQLAAQLNLKCEFTAAAAERSETRISFAVQQVDRDELLQAILDPVGLTHTILDDTLRVDTKAP